MVLDLHTIIFFIWTDRRLAFQVNVNLFLEYEMSDCVMLEIIYISVLSSPAQKPGVVSIPVGCY